MPALRSRTTTHGRNMAGAHLNQMQGRCPQGAKKVGGILLPGAPLTALITAYAATANAS